MCGTSDMDDVDGFGTQDGTTGRIARFYLADRKFCLSALRVHFSGGTGTATLYLKVDAKAGTPYDTTLFELTGAGTGVDINLRIPDEELRHWCFHPGDELTLEWENPDDGNMAWGATCDLLPAEAIGA